MTRTYNPEDGIWTEDQSGDTAASEHTTTNNLSPFGLNDKARSLQISLPIRVIPVAPSPLGHLGAFPGEVRIMVYRHLLVSEKLICQRNLLIGPQKQMMVRHNKYNKEIDGAILRRYSRSSNFVSH